jgi:hypothetical protein
MKDLLKLPFSMEIIMLASWSIWIIRNNKIFKNQEAKRGSWKAIYEYHSWKMGRQYI